MQGTINTKKILWLAILAMHTTEAGCEDSITPCVVHEEDKVMVFGITAPMKNKGDTCMPDAQVKPHPADTCAKVFNGVALPAMAMENPKDVFTKRYGKTARLVAHTVTSESSEVPPEDWWKFGVDILRFFGSLFVSPPENVQSAS